MGFAALIFEPVKSARKGALDSKRRGKRCAKAKWGGERRNRYAEHGRQGQRRQIQLEAAYLNMGGFGTAPKLNNSVPNDEMIEWTLVNIPGTFLAHRTSQLWTWCWNLLWFVSLFCKILGYLPVITFGRIDFFYINVICIFFNICCQTFQEYSLCYI